MSTGQDWTQTLQSAFPNEYDRIIQTVHVHPSNHQGELLRLFLDLASHISSPNDTISVNPKKRKLADLSTPSQSTTKAAIVTDPVVFFECKDVSFQIPSRKKLKLELIRDGVDRHQQDVRLRHPQTEDVEHTLSADKIGQVFCLPVPDKQQRQWSFCIVPLAAAITADDSPPEQIVFTVNETAPTGARLLNHESADGDTLLTMTTIAMNQLLEPYRKHVITPDAAHFASSVPQPHRKGEKAYHVKAHRGSKEGYLFFLENGIFFGFKKPLLFFPFHAIESVSYTSVLQRTFNLVIAAMEEGETEAKEFEFSMLDQSDFAGIDEYVKKRELQDASMAATRRAKVYNVNKDKDALDTTNGHAGVDEGVEEAQTFKTEQELQDEEDELEEDYEASGGESYGEGEDSEEDDEEGEGADEEEEEVEEEAEEEELNGAEVDDDDE